MGGDYVEVPGDSDTHPTGSAVSHPRWPTTRPFSAFHLPEVCRQIYAETAILGYKHNTFVVGYGIGRTTKTWASKLLQVQKEAIASLAPTDMFLETYISNMYRKSLREHFPGLRHVEVGAGCVDLCRRFMSAHLDPEKKMTTEDWQELIAKKINEKEGTDIEVAFGEKADMEAWKKEMMHGDWFD
jgi:hypothetical protein